METPPTEKHTAILDGAARVFAERGYEGASMSMITAAAGVSKGTIYQHFPGKAALFGATIARECEAMLADVFQGSGEAGDTSAVLRDVGTRMLALFTTPKAMAIERIVPADAARFPDLAEAFYAAGPARAIASMAGLLARETAAGRLLVPDPEFAAEQFFMLCQTRVVMRTRLGLACTPGEAARVVEEAVAVFVRAYGR